MLGGCGCSLPTPLFFFLNLRLLAHHWGLFFPLTGLAVLLPPIRIYPPLIVREMEEGGVGMEGE